MNDLTCSLIFDLKTTHCHKAKQAYSILILEDFQFYLEPFRIYGSVSIVFPSNITFLLMVVCQSDILFILIVVCQSDILFILMVVCQSDILFILIVVCQSDILFY